MKKTVVKSIPFEFVLHELDGVSPHTKPMFGALGVYVGNKIVFILRDREASPADNGVWLATTGDHHSSLQAEFPSMRSIEVFGPGPTGWQVLPADADDFEDCVLRACELVLAEDPRIGKIPKMRMKKKSVGKVAAAAANRKAASKPAKSPSKKKPVTKKITPKKSKSKK